MSGLRPTKARLALLQAVADGLVYESRWTPYDSEIYTVGDDGSRWRKVTTRCAEAHRAGWIELEPEDSAARWIRLWLLTDAGRAVLDGAE